MSKSAIVIGAGIVGLATARALAVRGYDVTVIERNERAIGASIRNFGMIWPIGQPDGELYERAQLSRSIWKEVCQESWLWHDPVGSLHLAYTDEEWNVLEELASVMRHRGYELLSHEETLIRSEAVVPGDLKGSLYSPDEIIVDPRQALIKIPMWLNEIYGVQFLWGRTATDISYPAVYTGTEQLEADEIYVCSGADFETLYPQVYAKFPIVKCKLQMMRMVAQPGGWRMGPALCGGLSLLHYNSFRSARSWYILNETMQAEYPEYLKWGIHVMAAQNQDGQITIGDSHEYSLTPDPFDKQFINQLIINYLQKFARFRDPAIMETWNGIYAKMTNGETSFVHVPEQGVTIINCLGGAGMTLSFGLAEQLIARSVKDLHVA